VGASAITADGLAAATQLACNYVTVDAAAGWGALGEMLAGCELASYVAGEYVAGEAPRIAQHHLPLAQAAGAAGIAIAL
jgi:hypothetical protein